MHGVWYIYTAIYDTRSRRRRGGRARRGGGRAPTPPPAAAVPAPALPAGACNGGRREAPRGCPPSVAARGEGRGMGPSRVARGRGGCGPCCTRARDPRAPAVRSGWQRLRGAGGPALLAGLRHQLVGMEQPRYRARVTGQIPAPGAREALQPPARPPGLRVVAARSLPPRGAAGLATATSRDSVVS